MTKYLAGFSLTCLFIAGCNTLGTSLAQPITLPNGKNGYSIDCSNYSGWPACFEVAGGVCMSGYNIHERSMGDNTKSEIPLTPLKEDLSDMRPTQPNRQQNQKQDKYMIISCK